jgi:hypothetical protein
MDELPGTPARSPKVLKRHPTVTSSPARNSKSNRRTPGNSISTSVNLDPESITARAHQARTSIKDIRHRRSSEALLIDMGTKLGSSGYLVPDCLCKANKIARLFCVGSTKPAQPAWHQSLVTAFVLACHGSIVAFVAVAVRGGTLSYMVAFAFFANQIVFLASFHHGKSKRTFDNILLMRNRTIHMLEKGGRLDMVPRVDEVLEHSVKKTFFIVPVFIAFFIAGFLWIYVYDDQDDIISLIAFMAAFQISHLAYGECLR